jgi:hypothetical protein
MEARCHSDDAILTTFEFATAGRIVFGRGRADEALAVALTYGRRILLVRGSHSWADHAGDVLRAAGAEVLVIRSMGEPDLAPLEAALAQARAFDRKRCIYPMFRRCCKTLAAKDSQRESMRLDGAHEQAITRPLPHDELVQLYGVSAQPRVFADPLPVNACLHA